MLDQDMFQFWKEKMQTFGFSRAVTPENVHELTTLLSKYDIDHTLWTTKSVDHLWTEYKNGECALKIIKNKLVRSIRVVKLYILSPDKTQILIEDFARYNMPDGTVVTRDKQNIPGEKLMIGDTDLYAAARRCLREEMMDDVREPLLQSLKKTSDEYENNAESLQYRGLNTVRTMVDFEAVIDETEFKPDGYSEQKGNRTTYFHWVDYAHFS